MRPTDNLRYFLGKVCTIHTVRINRDYHKENPQNYLTQMHVYYTAIIEDMDEAGILTRQLQTGLKSFFFWERIVDIAEEEVVDSPPGQPLETSATEEIPVPVGQFLNAAAMSELVKKLQKK